MDNTIEQFEMMMKEDAFLERPCKVYHPSENRVVPCTLLVYGKIVLIADMSRTSCYSAVVADKFSDFQIMMTDESDEIMKLQLTDTIENISTHELIFDKEDGQSFIDEYNNRTPEIIEFETKLMSGIECPECGEFLNVKKISIILHLIAGTFRLGRILHSGKYYENNTAKYKCLVCGTKWR